MRKIPVLLMTLSLSIVVLLGACNNKSEDNNVTPEATTLPDAFQKFANGTEVTLSGDFIVIKAKGVPDHKSPYWGRGNTLYEAYNGTNVNFKVNPNVIAEQNFTFRIPLNPKEATSKAATPMGAIGVALNGVAIFNQFAAPGDDLTQEIDSFDQYNGHPTGTSVYHYHIEPTYLTASNKSGLVGFLLDGFPVYGPQENGKTLTSRDLDDYHGHTGVTADYPNGIYHYHITADTPYINGDGFFGTAGTVTQ